MEEEGSSLLEPDGAPRKVAREDTETELSRNHFHRVMAADQDNENPEDELDPWEKRIYTFAIIGGTISIVGLCFCVSGILGFIIILCLISQAAGVAMGRWVLSLGEGTESMKAVGSAIREGSQAYVATMFGTIAILLLPTAILVFGLHLMQMSFSKALMIAITFIFGAACSSAAGMIGMWSSTRANARVAQMSCSSTFRETLVIALRSGSVCGITVVSMSVFSISVLFTVCYICVEGDFTRIPELLIGYGFGASFVALFAQLGGGIFTKAADVGADLCGKIELDIPEDDPRNPAVIADLVGDNVGDCCARGADLFESLSAEIIAAMILAGSLARNTRALSATDAQLGYLLFPLVIHVIDLIASTIGVVSVSSKPEGRDREETGLDPMTLLKQGYKFAIVCSSIGFILACRFMLHVESAPYAWRHFAACGFVGMGTGFLIVLITQYYTDFSYAPVKGIALAAEMGGHGTNVIAGLSVGMKSTMLPVIVVCTAILLSFNLGKTSGLDFKGIAPISWNTFGPDENPGLPAGLFGTAVATMGMLSNLTYVLAMDVFGPITDNAAGIVEMSPECQQSARDTMDRLDAAGNTTKAFTKGFAVGSAGLACFLLFRAFLDIIEEGSGKKVTVDIVAPEVFIGGLVGGSTVFLFAGIAMDAVGETAQKVVVEVRRQFNDVPGIATGEREPQYGACVSIVSSAAIKKMIKPGFIVLAMPIIVGKLFHAVGESTGDDLLGAKAITSYLVVSSMTAMLVALFLNNGGGAWDNAKKLIESGSNGGKGSDAHKAAVTGDTVGDPCKDTAGPSLHVLMKLTATVIMVIGPLITMPSSAVQSTTPVPR